MAGRPKPRPFATPSTHEPAPFEVRRAGAAAEDEWHERAAILQFDAGLDWLSAGVTATRMVLARYPVTPRSG